MLDPPSSTHPDFDETWRRLESLVDVVAQWAKDAVSQAEFYSVLLRRTVAELQAAGGAVWNLDSRQRLQRIDLMGSPAIDAMTQQPSHLAGIRAAFTRGTEVSKSWAEPFQADQAKATTEDLVSCLTPVIVDDEIVAMLELVLSAGTAATGRDNAEHVMAALADVSVDFHRAFQLRDLRQRAATWNTSQEFSDCVHRRLDLDETCYSIANEGRRFVGADRISVLVARGGSLRVGAISGVDSIDRRSPDVILMRRLASAVALGGDPLWTQDSLEQPPQVRQFLDAYHDASGARCLAILPIKSEPSNGKSRLLGVLVAEQFQGDKFEAACQERLAIGCLHAKTALANALEMNSLPLLWVSRSMRRVGWLFGLQSITSLTLMLIASLLFMGAGVATLCLVPIDFTVTARGQLQPIEQRDIFAPADGVVQEILVQHGEEVAGGAVLVKLRNTELDYETGRLLGDLATTRAKLQAFQAARLTAGRDRRQMDQVNAEIERLKQILVGMEQQREILQRQRHALDVRSPLAGQVMSWEADKTLASRPVRQGQRLMTIANVRGPWHLEVDVPDDDIGHVIAARQQLGGGNLPVTFILLTDPASVHRGDVADVALTTSVTGNREPAVQITVAIDSAALTSPRPGAGVVARIHCGRRSIGYVWFHRVYEQLRMRTMF